MSLTLEADVALIHIAGGGARVTPPPGTLAETAPRRAARGRSEDMFFVSLGVQSAQPLTPGLVDHLAHLASQAFFATPGSVTAALREAAAAVNDHLLDLNQQEAGAANLQGRMLTAVLRDRDLYLAQAGIGQAALVRPGQVSRLSSEEAAGRPLGATSAPFLRFNHLEAQPGDLLVMAPSPPPAWSDPTLSGLAELDLPQAVERLAAASSHDLTGLIIRLTLPGETAPVSPSAAAPRRAEGVPARPARRPRSTARTRAPAALPRWLAPAATRLQALAAQAGAALLRLLARMAPGLVEPSRPGALSPALLAGTAVAVPLIVVALTSLVYLRRGRAEQFQEYLSQAQAAVVAAQLKPNPADARADWDRARQLLDQAARYGETGDSSALSQVVQEALDGLDLVYRMDFRPVISGGFGRGARLTALAATATDLYVLDGSRQVIWHAWATGRGYDIDRDFKCLNGPGSVRDLGSPVALAAQGEPGALGVEGVVAIDGDGTLLYCAPGRAPVTGQLAPPDTGWGHIQAIDVSNGKLYVLDPKANAVWVYDATDGLFSGSPSLFFAESVPDLQSGIGLAMTQDELFVLHDDGRLDRCRRSKETGADGAVHIRVDCEKDPRYTDERANGQAGDHIPGALPVAVVYGPPPEPSLYFLDKLTGGVFHYSMRLVYQGLYLPSASLEGEVTALALGPPNDLFIAAGTQVYHLQPRR